MAFDFKSGLGGAGTGATYGGVAGGPWGALLGGGLGALGGFFGGSNETPNKLSTFDPYQKQLYEQKTQALQGGGGPLADVYGQFNPEMMKNYYETNFAQPAYQEFQQNVVPQITGQFRGKNLQNSSYLGGALSQAGTNVQNNLNAQMANLLYSGQQSHLTRRSNGIDNILNLQSHVNERPQSSVFDSLLESLAGGAGDILGKYFKNRNNKTPNTADQTPQTAGTQPTIGG